MAVKIKKKKRDSGKNITRDEKRKKGKKLEGYSKKNKGVGGGCKIV